MCYLRAGDAAGVQLPSPGLRASHCSLLAFLESDGELINSAPAKRSQSLSVGSTSSDAAREDAVEDALRSESRRSHAELGDCGLDSSVAHEEAAICPARSTAREAPAHAFSRELSEDRQGFPGFGKPNSPSTSEAVDDYDDELADQDYASPVGVAAANGHYEVVRYVWTLHPPRNCKRSDCLTPLLACMAPRGPQVPEV